MKFKPGDRVSVLDEILNGWVINSHHGIVTVEFDDGFQLDYREEHLIHEAGSDLRRAAGPQHISDADSEEPKKKKTAKKSKKKREANQTVLEIDLHIEKLLPSTKGMDKHDIRTYQIETAQRQLEFAIRNRIPKIIFVHGVGEGILKSELDFLLGRYDGVRFYEASYRKYGFGATEVKIQQDAKRH